MDSFKEFNRYMAELPIVIYRVPAMRTRTRKNGSTRHTRGRSRMR